VTEITPESLPSETTLLFRMPAGLDPGNYVVKLIESVNKVEFTVVRKALSVQRLPSGSISTKF
jgi:hypothetical protein